MALLRGLTDSFRHLICCNTPAEEEAPPKSPTVPLSSAVQEAALQIFRLIDTDNSHSISVSETAHWWRSFSKVNTKAMFAAVDADGNGEISEAEWLEFWTHVRSHGYSEEEIEEELRNIREGVSWATLDYKNPT